MNLKLIGLFLIISIFIIGGIYFGFLETGNKNLFSQISGVSGNNFKFVGEIELENDFANQNNSQKNNNQNVAVKPAKKNKKTPNLNENIVKVVSGVADAAITSATSTIVSSASSTPIVENNAVQISSPAQEQNIVPDIPATSTTPIIPTALPVQSNAANHILISEIMVGMEGNVDYEFIELFNPTSQSIDLTGWSIKKKSSTGSESTLVSSSRLEGKIIPANKYYLFANEGGYSGSVSPDVFWPKSYTLAYSNNSVIIYNANNELIEEVAWTEIQKGHSIERVSWDSNEFKIQLTPNPQNSTQ